MTHRFPIKEIALQSGLGPATVDRVLNSRANVSTQARLRVEAAISELAAQEQQLAARGRRMFIDVVVEAPVRFSKEVRRAAEVVLPTLSGAVLRPRFVMQEVMSERDVLACLTQIGQRGSQGIILKARDTPAIRTKIDALDQQRIPTVTLVTDISAERRVAYVGLDNYQAGRTAGYLLAQSLPDQVGTVLTTKSQGSFLGEDARDRGLRDVLSELRPNLTCLDASGGSGVPFETAKEIDRVVEGLSEIRAVYSMGGGNKAILDRLAHHRLPTPLYVAHDLDAENRDLLTNRLISFVLHHDLREDMRNAFLHFLFYARLLSQPPQSSVSDIQLITPENIPTRFDW